MENSNELSPSERGDVAQVATVGCQHGVLQRSAELHHVEAYPADIWQSSTNTRSGPRVLLIRTFAEERSLCLQLQDCRREPSRSGQLSRVSCASMQHTISIKKCGCTSPNPSELSHISHDDNRIYDITLFSYLFAFSHFGSELLIFRTASFGPGALSPVIVSSE